MIRSGFGQGRVERALRRAFGNAQHHYDIGNDLYEAMLDKRMLYTCALWSTRVEPKMGEAAAWAAARSLGATASAG